MTCGTASPACRVVGGGAVVWGGCGHVVWGVGTGYGGSRAITAISRAITAISRPLRPLVGPLRPLVAKYGH